LGKLAGDAFGFVAVLGMGKPYGWVVGIPMPDPPDQIKKPTAWNTLVSVPRGRLTCFTVTSPHRMAVAVHSVFRQKLSIGHILPKMQWQLEFGVWFVQPAGTNSLRIGARRPLAGAMAHVVLSKNDPGERGVLTPSVS
jgi:hypothetical protein